MISSQLSMMNTLLTYSLMLFLFFLFSNKSNGARFGTNKRARNSNCPSTEKCLTARWSSQSLVKLLKNSPYSSAEMSSELRVHRGLVLLSSSWSMYFSLMVFFFFLSADSDSSFSSRSSTLGLSSSSFFSSSLSSSSSCQRIPTPHSRRGPQPWACRRPPSFPLPCLLLVSGFRLLILVEVLNLGLVVVLLLFLFLVFFLIFFFLVIRNLLFPLLLNMKADRVADELGVLLDNVLDPLLFQVLLLVFLDVKDDLGTSGQIILALFDGERTSG